jgi:hypothetical protein
VTLGESISYVFRQRSKALLIEFVRSDLPKLISELNLPEVIKSVPKLRVKSSFRQIASSAQDLLRTLRVLPRRFRDGFLIFRREFLRELDELNDPREKTVFSFKVMVALCGTSASTIYAVRTGHAHASIPGVRPKNFLIQQFLLEIGFRALRLFLHRLVDEIEAVSDESEKENFKYLRSLLGNSKEDEDSERSIEIVENFKSYILHGPHDRGHEKS